MSLHPELVTAPIALVRLDSEVDWVYVVILKGIGCNGFVIAVRTLVLAQLLVVEFDVIGQVAEKVEEVEEKKKVEKEALVAYKIS